MRIFLAGVLAAPFALGGLLASDVPAIGQRTLRFHDGSRQRPLIVELWYPALATPGAGEQRATAGPYAQAETVQDGKPRAGNHPLILLSHGTGGGRLTMEWLAVGLARRGHLVAAVDHWGNTYDNPIPEYFLKSWERPQDLSFVLNELLRHPAFAPVIDVGRIGAIGFSLGGYTVLALAGGNMDLEALDYFSLQPEGQREAEIPELPRLLQYLHEPQAKERLNESFRRAPPLRDARVKAVVALAPALGQAFTRAQQFPSEPPPVLIIGANADHLAPVATNAAHYHTLIPRSRLVILDGPVGHYVFLNEAPPALREQLPALFVDDPSVDRRSVHAQVISLAASFFAEHLGEPASPGGP